MVVCWYADLADMWVVWICECCGYVGCGVFYGHLWICECCGYALVEYSTGVYGYVNVVDMHLWSILRVFMDMWVVWICECCGYVGCVDM